MGRFTRWLCQRYLPALAREQLTAENAQLALALEQERQRTVQLREYIRGMERALQICGMAQNLKEVQANGRIRKHEQSVGANPHI